MFATLAICAGAGLEVRAEGALVLSHRVEKVEAFVNDGGAQETRLVPAELVYEGDELRYTITFTNESDETVAPDSIVVTNRIPESTRYLPGSASGSGSTVEFSVDGGKSFARPEALTVRDEEGERLAQPADYTTIRWRYAPALPPGEQREVYFRVRML